MISFIIHTPVFEKLNQTKPIEMGSIPPPQLAFDSRPPSFLSKPIADFLTEVSMAAAGNVPHRASNLDALLNRLEDEMRKIDAFKRELPLSMHLLNHAIVALKDESVRFSTRNAEPVLEEFIPMKDNRSDNDDDEDDDGESITTRKENESTDSNKDKKSWMSSVQLWNNDEDCHSVQKSKIESRREIEDSFEGFKTGGGTKSSVPFKVSEARKDEIKELQVQELSFLTSGVKDLKEESDSTGSRSSFRRVVSSDPNLKPTFRSGQQQQTARKPRRCWSPELHRRFVSALQQLGGCQVATPKQIRELMQVDGLTNDEVKSHLQKYRLHTRRMPAPANQPMVALGSGLWLSQDQHGDSVKASNSQSSSPEGPLQLATNAGGANSMFDDDGDTKSESCSWRSNVNMAVKEDDV